MVREILVHQDRLIPQPHGGALVKSASDESGWHLVEHGVCDCRGYYYRGRCRHVVAVAEYYGLDRDAELQAEARAGADAQADADAARKPRYGRTPAAAFDRADDGEYETIHEFLERRGR